MKDGDSYFDSLAGSFRAWEATRDPGRDGVPLAGLELRDRYLKCE